MSDIYAALGDDLRAEEAGVRAVELVQSKPRVHPVDAAIYLGLIEHQLRLNRDVRALLQEALARFPDNLHLTWLRGLMLMRQQRYADARTRFERLLDCGRSDDFFGWIGYDRRILADYSRQCLSICIGSQADGPSH